MLRHVLAFLFFVLITPFTFAQDGSSLGSEDPTSEPGGGVVAQVAPSSVSGEPTSFNTCTDSKNSGKGIDSEMMVGPLSQAQRAELIEHVSEYLGVSDSVLLEKLRKEESKEIIMILQHWIDNK